MNMLRSILLAGLLVVLCQGYETQQVQMPEAGALLDSDEGLLSQVQSLQRNITELWTYIHSLRNAVTQHLNHLRQHQVELESTVHKLEHAGGGTHAAHTDDQHSHSGEHHSHSGEHHSHSGEHHSHSGEHHSHGGDDHQHSHSGEHHSHSGDSDHSHSSGGDHHHDSHSHTSDHSSHSDGHHHGDSHESEDVAQQSQQGADSMPLVAPTPRQGGHHSHSGHASPSAFKPLQLMTEQGHHHHHHHDTPAAATSRNATRMAAVVIPKYSEYGLYDFAVCNVQPNRAIPEDQQQNVMGQITLWQKKLGGALNIHVKVQGFSMGDHHGAHQALQSVQVAHQQEQEENETPAEGAHRHGFHIHTSGDLSNGCQSTGPHFNPKNVNHGAPNALVRHVGDLGNIECDDHGIANLIFSDNVASLRGQYSIIGKSMVIHAKEDDLGLGGDEESTKTGNAGTRIACCVIQKVDKLPIRSYKAMKSAIPRT